MEEDLKPVLIEEVLEDRVEIMFTIPYIGLLSILFSEIIKLIFKEHYQIDLKIVFTTF